LLIFFGGHKRNRKPESATGAFFTVKADCAIHQFDEALANRESKPGSTELASGGAVRLHKRLEQSRTHRSRQTNARIFDLESDQHRIFTGTDNTQAAFPALAIELVLPAKFA